MRFEDIIGQGEVIARLKGYGEFFASKGSTPGHILLVGDDGMGKSSIANVFANEMGVGFQEADASKLEIIGDVSALLTNLKLNQILFLKNIHLSRKTLANKLGQPLTDFKCEIHIGQGPAQRLHIMDIHPFTLIATCPKKSDCPPELLGEFSLILSLQPYSKIELQAIADSIAKKLEVTLELDAAELLARNCDGRPSDLQSTLRRVLRAHNKKTITAEDVQQTFQAFGIHVRTDEPLNLVDGLKDLSGVDFEKLIVSLLARMEFQAEMTQTSGDGGIDIIATLNKPIFGGRYLFQCKRYSAGNLVGAPTLRDFYGAVTADRAIKGIFITTSDYTPQAREFGEKSGLELINLQQLQKLFFEYGLLTIGQA